MTGPLTPWQRVRRGLSGPDGGAPRHLLVRWLFLHGLALVYLVAFVDLWSQMAGLLGSGGILPARTFLEDNHTQAVERFFRVPTVFWLDASDLALHAACLAGVVLALLLFLRVAPALVLLGLFVLYLSFVSVGQVFYQYQWDHLLLEVGFAAIFVAPWRGLPLLDDEEPPSPWVVWWLRVVTVRLMVSSGGLKLLVGNAPWHDLTALRYHFWTQPLPTWTAWLAHQLPDALLSAGVVLTLVVQGPLALCGLGPRRLRLVAAVALALHQSLIFLTGNYTFFNLLALAMIVTLLDDGYLARVLPRRVVAAAASDRPRASAARRRLVVAFAVLGLTLNGFMTVSTFRLGEHLPKPAVRALHRARALGVVAGYGLFVNMTTHRPEIVLEGSHDGTTWLPYELPYKPGRLDRRPAFVAPFQPRLDWQLWFAALGNVRYEPWVVDTMYHLSAGTPEVLALFAHDPFAGDPPRYVRARYFDYAFTSWKELRAEGRWWTRRTRGSGMYAAPVDSGER